MKIGHEHDARFIRDWSILMAENCRYGETPPSGWTRLGAGAYRSVFLNEATQTAYKVEHQYNGVGQSNASEARNLRKLYLRKMPGGCRLPRWSLYELDGRTVMAMEKFNKLIRDFNQYDQEGATYHASYYRLKRAMHEFWDLHQQNVAVDDNGLVVPIDLGE